MNPAAGIGGESPGWDHAMDMRVMPEILTPGMEHREETDLRSEMLGVDGNLQKGFGAGPEQQVVEELLVLQQQWRELVGQGKDHVEVADREEFFLARREPAVTGCDLTLWAVPIATGVEDDGT